MSFEIVVQSEAIIEIQKVFEWYEQSRPGLGFEMIQEIEEGFERLSKHPHNYSATNKKYRKVRINRFPYIIVFEIEDTKVIIIALRHIKQESSRR
ncbi:MAG TPA: type II toxin-antitoxin system RelE/ParE family toxin [Puia sp.]|nr:type II toxin-antitoxin system RelE/ParE family toxin [Puia sp.]